MIITAIEEGRKKYSLNRHLQKKKGESAQLKRLKEIFVNQRLIAQSGKMKIIISSTTTNKINKHTANHLICGAWQNVMALLTGHADGKCTQGQSDAARTANVVAGNKAEAVSGAGCKKRLQPGCARGPTGLQLDVFDVEQGI